jgi:hypothetical protein
VGRPADWWPVSDTDPVPGDPETLATFGRKMRDVATAIGQLADTLPRLASSQEWDSDAGEAFRTKARSFAATVGKSRGRFLAVATALGTSPYAGSGYAAALQSCQDEAGAQLKRVTGSSGSEALRLRAWSRLVEATGGLSPEHPVPKPGSTSGAARVPAGACPTAAPGQIPPDLPGCTGDSSQVTALKATYNETLGTLRSAALKISQTASDQATAAQRAAIMIRDVIDSDGLNNPTGLDALFRDAENFFDDHVVGVLKAISEISGWIATACGIIAMVLAFIPGMQEFAAAFETLSLLATAVQLICNLVLAATGHGSWISVGLDAIALVTMGAARGLTGTAAEDSGAMFSSGSAISNADIVESGAGLARTSATVSDVAARAGIDLGNSTVRIIEDSEYLRYLDSQGACACAPYDLPGEIHLGPASFTDEVTLAATLAHEQEHVLQYAAGYVPGSGDLEAMEAAARAAEGPAVARLLGVEP